MVLDVDSQFEDTVFIRIVECGDHAEVVHGDLRLRPQEHITFDTAEAPEVLAFQIRTGAPSEYLQGKYVFTRLQIFVDQEFGRILGVFAVTDFLSVYINVKARFGSGDMQIDIASVPSGRYFEVAAVNTYRVSFRQLRRLRITWFELIPVIGIDSCAMSLNFPVARNGNIIPGRSVC